MNILAIDAGGTSIKAAPFYGEKIGEVSVRPSHAAEGGPRFIEEICRVIEEYPFCERVALSVTGQVDPSDGSITYANSNVPGFTGTPLRQLLQARCGRPVTVENDVNAAALGEAAFGAGRGYENFFCLTYGTGVGGALILNGGLYRGSHGCAGQIGRLLTHPGEADGFYEARASAAALVRKANALHPAVTDGKTFFKFLREGDENLSRLLDLWIDEVVLGLVSFIYMLDPACLVLGGGLLQEPGLADRIQKRCISALMPGGRTIVLKAAELGNLAGLYGAYLLAVKEG
ncbi:MAG: ROK family protein [Oscillospiraceae bacterium]|nr:ROK family protein [Oscillospiraceae bacterium]